MKKHPQSFLYLQVSVRVCVCVHACVRVYACARCRAVWLNNALAWVSLCVLRGLVFFTNNKAQHKPFVRLSLAYCCCVFYVAIQSNQIAESGRAQRKSNYNENVRKSSALWKFHPHNTSYRYSKMMLRIHEYSSQNGVGMKIATQRMKTRLRVREAEGEAAKEKSLRYKSNHIEKRDKRRTHAG